MTMNGRLWNRREEIEFDYRFLTTVRNSSRRMAEVEKGQHNEIRNGSTAI
jgi:hypothetical protein